MQLRPYQIDLVRRVGAALSEHRSVLLQLPTGGGKTHIAAHVAGVSAAVGERVWMIAHRREIVGQTSRSMTSLGVPHGVVGAGRPFEPDRPVQVCAIGSLTRRADALPSPDLMIWDEAHHVAAKSWAALRARFPDVRHLGLTATPERLDGKGLGDFFAELICGPTTAELMAAGHLSPYRLFAPTIPDLRGVDVRAGDWAREQLAERMSGATLVGDAVEHYRRHADDARAIAFCVTVEASKALAARFNAAGIPAAHVGGDTPAEERDASIAALEAGRLRVLTNVEVFTEGFDLPVIDAVIFLRPTRSLALHRQMVGRGLRAAPGKGATIILDHAGLFYEHGLPDDAVEWSLDQPARRRMAFNVERLRRCPECSAVHPMAWACPECGRAYAVADRTIQEVFADLQEVRRPNGNIPPFGYPDGACEPQMIFARRVGIPYRRIYHLVKAGMPSAPNGWIIVEPAIAWIESNGAAKPRFAGDTMRQFADRMSTTRKQVHLAKKAGLPLEDDGSVKVQDAMLWWKTWPRRCVTRFPAGFETLAAFVRRVGRTDASRLAKLGLTREPNGLIHIEKGLAWLSEHRPKARRKRR
ncbi:DEAD/DEAH box helicase [Methylobacterium sp. E-065]|uniref:DEAD/DEAH box helicase n=1 Tax=Methylobacterium sp. E-065 TaxID=2836583 RepID=UPI001FBB59B8|nr:DEAD/DEAH box helicase [Methylobacterium sp. E-065]MCJ2020607.1 DEAD/DEAH box helicase [Methylobacterium sp. E-065]